MTALHAQPFYYGERHSVTADVHESSLRNEIMLPNPHAKFVAALAKQHLHTAMPIHQISMNYVMPDDVVSWAHAGPRVGPKFFWKPHTHKRLVTVYIPIF